MGYLHLTTLVRRMSCLLVLLRSSSVLKPDHDKLFVITLRLSCGLLFSGGYVKYVRTGTHFLNAALHGYLCQTRGRENLSVRCVMRVC